MTSETLSVKQAAERFSVHPNTIKRWCKTEQIGSFRVGPRGWLRIPAEAVEAKIRQMERQA